MTAVAILVLAILAALTVAFVRGIARGDAWVYHPISPVAFSLLIVVAGRWAVGVLTS